MATVAPAAFCGAACAVLPDMLDRREEPGFMPALADILGDASLTEPGRFAALCASGSRLGTAFADAWKALVDEVRDAQGGDIEVGPLAVPVEDAGLDDNGLPILRVQREVSRQREAAAAAVLKAELSACLLYTSPSPRD